MIDMQRQQCLEEAQLENETTGESGVSGGVLSSLMSRAPFKAYGSHNSQSDGDQGHSHKSQSSGPQTQKGRPPHSPDPSHIWGVPSSSLGTAFKGPAMPAGLPKETDLRYSVISFHGETGGFCKPQPLPRPPWDTPNQLPQPLTYLELRRDQSAGLCKQPIRTNERGLCLLGLVTQS